jgi:hypothetical protein
MKKRATPRQQDLQTLINNLLAATASLQNATTTLANAQAGFNAALNAYDSAVQGGNQQQITAAANALLSAVGVLSAAEEGYNNAQTAFQSAWQALVPYLGE